MNITVINNADDYLDEIRRYHSVVNTIQSSRLKLSNSTVYSYEEDPSYPDNSLHDGSGSGNYPDDDTEHDDDDDDLNEASGQLPESEPAHKIPSSSTNGIDFPSPWSTTPFPRIEDEDDDDLFTGPAGSCASAQLSTTMLMVSLMVLVYSVRHCR